MLTYDSADGGTIFLEDEKSLGAGGRGNVFPVLFDRVRMVIEARKGARCRFAWHGRVKEENYAHV